MFHLAQVIKVEASGALGLRMLAYQKTETTWVLAPAEDVLASDKASVFVEGSLVLVQLSSKREILTIADAKDWVIDLVRKYLTLGITPAFLQQEAERAEQWRQSLTLESQELARRTMELEARREQIESLEEDLKQERQKLELLATQLRMTGGLGMDDLPD
ncbi:hypothetical protein BST81_05560 [Leptolyngbya sp. 'hensonii']|uniref:hypothetical protein n=1 Tax=Leptolyngbya sp. 'hensonii' TaxID=1922337 RepID=UPI00094FD72E|nr:hypothetical protein [Leptolyngbya sp. 'hensonii']OLP19231.1 hypothetical protein BST81_05560 [Leptolyngbya sp. 'hensonii']